MANLVAKSEELKAYGTLLEKKAEEFNSITKKMEDIVARLEAGWEGSDADNFKSNATAYIKNLKTVEGTLKYYGDAIKSKSARYSNICSDFYSILNR